MNQTMQQKSDTKSEGSSELNSDTIKSPSREESFSKEPARQDYISHLFSYNSTMEGAETTSERFSSLLTGPLMSHPVNSTPRNQTFLQMQQIFGNHYVQRMVEKSRSISQEPGTRIQAKLKIGQPNDIYEQEADRIADQVMRMPEPKESLVQRNSTCPEYLEEEEIIQTKPIADQITPLVQRQTDLEEEEKKEEEIIQTKPFDAQKIPSLRRQFDEKEEEEEILQTKVQTGRAAEVTPSIDTSIKSIRGGGQPLSESDRSYFEPRFGVDFSQVRVHTNSQAAKIAHSLNAKAFTFGNDMVFGSGQYSTGTAVGKNLLAHELTHVLQQNNTHTGPRMNKDAATFSSKKIAGEQYQIKCSHSPETVRLSPLSDELRDIWWCGDKELFFHRLRNLGVWGVDIDTEIFIWTNLFGDDYWLARNILDYGHEENWPIHLRVEREMKECSDCGGASAVFEILRQANGSEAGNAELTGTISSLLMEGTMECWYAHVLQALGPESKWPGYLTCLWSDIQAGTIEVPPMLVSGSELVFEEMSIPRQHLYNCYAYAWGVTFDKIDPGKEVDFAHMNREGILSLLWGDMGPPVDCDSVCPSGERKIMAFVTDDAIEYIQDLGVVVNLIIQPDKITIWMWDYHFYRQDIGGIWSHKIGEEPHQSTDPGGDRILDPRSAGRTRLFRAQDIPQFPGIAIYIVFDYRNLVGCWCVAKGFR